MTLDVNCLLGHWPFRKLYKPTIEDMQQVHIKNNISYGFVSSLNSIFYNDPFEGEEELHEIIKNTSYQHILTVNPTLPGFERDIERGVLLFKIKGVRIYPGYHNYTLDNKKLENLCKVLKAFDLPLLLTCRMEDERFNYLFHPNTISLDEISAFIEKNKDIKIILLNIRTAELSQLKDMLNSNDNVFFDTSGLRNNLFVIEKLLLDFNPEKIVYGSLHPLYCMRSTLLSIENAEVPKHVKEKILHGNAEMIFK